MRDSRSSHEKKFEAKRHFRNHELEAEMEGPQLRDCNDRYERKEREKKRRVEEEILPRFIAGVPHSPFELAFSERRTSNKIPCSIWPTIPRATSSYFPQDVRPPPRRRATPNKIRIPLPLNSKFSPTKKRARYTPFKSQKNDDGI